MGGGDGVQCSRQKTCCSMGVAGQQQECPSGQETQGGEKPMRKQTAGRCLHVPGIVPSMLRVLTLLPHSQPVTETGNIALLLIDEEVVRVKQ